MELHVALKNSLLLPKKDAVFRLNRISMRDTIVYLFLFLFISFSPTFIIHPLLSVDLTTGKSLDLLLLQMIVLYPFLCVLLGIVGISMLAAGGLVITKLLQRKLRYQQLWKMSVFACTLPLIIYFVTALFSLQFSYLYVLLIIIFYIYILFMIRIYPKRRVK